MGYVTMSRAQATALLGVADDADAEQVRRAWRAWARLAHPDHGGDREFFERLRTARDVLLSGTDVVAEPPTQAPSDVSSAPVAPPARLGWSQVLRRPRFGEVFLLGVLAVGAVALAAMVTMVGPSPEPLALALAASPAAVAAAGWAHLAVSRVLTGDADVAHRITALVAAWLPITAAQIVLAGLLGSSLISVLPVLVVPLVVVVAAINPGAGLWRSHPHRAIS